MSLDPFQFVAICLAGWINQQQLDAIEYLREENRILRQQLGGVQPIMLPASSPNLNAFAERWVRSIRSECLSNLVLFGETSLRRTLAEFLKHYHHERNHQGKDNLLLFPTHASLPRPNPAIHCIQRLGGLLRFYQRAA